MNKLLQKINEVVYEKCALILSGYTLESESQEYAACRFNLNSLKILCRNAKVTPKKVGQFVTSWKRDEDGKTIPFNEYDQIDFVCINVKSNHQIGQFVFPKIVLEKHGIISTTESEGKRGFRLYPSWDKVSSKQAIKTQKWQLNYFYVLNDDIDLLFVAKLFQQP